MSIVSPISFSFNSPQARGLTGRGRVLFTTMLSTNANLPIQYHQVTDRDGTLYILQRTLAGDYIQIVAPISAIVESVATIKEAVVLSGGGFYNMFGELELPAPLDISLFEHPASRPMQDYRAGNSSYTWAGVARYHISGSARGYGSVLYSCGKLITEFTGKVTGVAQSPTHLYCLTFIYPQALRVMRIARVDSDVCISPVSEEGWENVGDYSYAPGVASLPVFPSSRYSTSEITGVGAGNASGTEMAICVQDVGYIKIALSGSCTFTPTFDVEEPDLSELLEVNLVSNVEIQDNTTYPPGPPNSGEPVYNYNNTAIKSILSRQVAPPTSDVTIGVDYLGDQLTRLIKTTYYPSFEASSITTDTEVAVSSTFADTVVTGGLTRVWECNGYGTGYSYAWTEGALSMPQAVRGGATLTRATYSYSVFIDSSTSTPGFLNYLPPEPIVSEISISTSTSLVYAQDVRYGTSLHLDSYSTRVYKGDGYPYNPSDYTDEKYTSEQGFLNGSAIQGTSTTTISNNWYYRVLDYSGQLRLPPSSDQFFDGTNKELGWTPSGKKPSVRYPEDVNYGLASPSEQAGFAHDSTGNLYLAPWSMGYLAPAQDFPAYYTPVGYSISSVFPSGIDKVWPV